MKALVQTTRTASYCGMKEELRSHKKKSKGRGKVTTTAREMRMSQTMRQSQNIQHGAHYRAARPGILRLKPLYCQEHLTSVAMLFDDDQYVWRDALVVIKKHLAL